MSKFNKLSRAEMKEVTGGDFSTCTYRCPGPGGSVLVLTRQSCNNCPTAPDAQCPAPYNNGGATCEYDSGI